MRGIFPPGPPRKYRGKIPADQGDKPAKRRAMVEAKSFVERLQSRSPLRDTPLTTGNETAAWQHANFP